ncbi:MAG: dTMP kinase, partial [Actinomycetota bacterium]
MLRDRNYRLWFFAALSSGLGDWIGLVALQALVASLSADAAQARLQLFALGGIMMARLLPSLLMGPVAGVLADRYDRKRLLVATNLLRGGLFAVIAFSGDLIALFALTFAVETFSLLFLSAKDALLPNLVDRRYLPQANQLNLLVTYGTLPFGAFVGTVMVLFAGALEGLGLATVEPTVAALLVNAMTFLIAAGLLSRLRLTTAVRRPQASRDESVGVIAEFREGLRFIRDLPVIRALITGVVGVFFGAGAVITLGPAFVSQTLGRPETDWFTLMTAVGSGLVAGLAASPFVTRRVRSERAFALGLASTAALAVLIGVLQSYLSVLAGGAALGFAAGFSFVIGYTLLQQHTRDDIRGKTFAAFYTSTRVAMFASLGLAPFVAGAIGQGTLIVGGGIVTMSGVRITIILAGLVAFLAAFVSGRALWRVGGDEDRPVRLLRGAPLSTTGRFIAFEGGEGTGKSTQVGALAATLREEGYDVVVTREPGGPPVAERIREVLLDPDGGPMDPRTEALLYAAARAEHVAEVIRPALEQGKVVISDRFLDSSLVYQGMARGLGEDDVGEINRWAIEDLLPDAVVLLTLDVDEGLRRARGRTDDAHAGEQAPARVERDAPAPGG